MDIKYAQELGYCIKHVGISRIDDDSIECIYHPVSISKDNIFSNVGGVMNAHGIAKVTDSAHRCYMEMGQVVMRQLQL